MSDRNGERHARVDKPDGRRRILALVDFKLRDLPGLVLLKVALERLGPYDITLGSTLSGTWDRVYLGRVKPHLVLLPGVWTPKDVERTRRLREQGIGVAIVPTEGMGHTADVRLSIAGLHRDLSAVDILFVWNEVIADLVRQHETVDLDRHVVAGVPRFDLYHPRFRSLFMSRAEFCKRYDIDPQAQVVSWATNFGWTLFHGKPAWLADAVARYRAEGLDWDIPARVMTEVATRGALSDMVASLARENRDVAFVVKIHPTEEVDWYRAWVAATGLANIRLVRQEYIWDVLHATDVHLHRSCTTAIEAWLLARPTIDVQCGPSDGYVAKEMFAGGDVAHSYESLREQLRHYLSGGTVSAEHLAARGPIIEWFAGRVDGEATARHADAIDTWFASNAPREPSVVQPTWRDARHRLSDAVKRFAGLEPHHSIRSWLLRRPQDARGKYFTEAEADQWASRINAVIGTVALERSVR